jgi:hypothetical protein
MGDDEPVLPDYAGACVCNIVPAVLEPGTEPGPWFPEAALESNQVVLLVLDGLGWNQLQSRLRLAPTMAAATATPITTVAPTTTATALTSITTGLTPGQHGVIGYRIRVGPDVLNVLRWSTAQGDARGSIPPHEFQKAAPFGSQRSAVVNRAEYIAGGFTGAHLDGSRYVGYRCTSTMVTEVRRFLREGEPFVYAYYDGVDKVAHEYGLTEYYDEELTFCDQLVADMIEAMPRGATLLVTADHGQVHTGDQVFQLHDDVMQHVASQSGEGRFRWLHALAGRAVDLRDALEAHHGRHGWVRTRDEVIDEQWFGPTVTTQAASRLGDVAIAAKGVCAFFDPNDTGPYKLIGRHGSLTADEVYVPLLSFTR